MLKHIRIHGYKCLEECELALAPLTILAGPNSSGKSTVIQAMLLVSAGIDQKNTPYLKELIKPYSQFDDVYCRFSNAREIRIDIEAENVDHGLVNFSLVKNRTRSEVKISPAEAPATASVAAPVAEPPAAKWNATVATPAAKSNAAAARADFDPKVPAVARTAKTSAPADAATLIYEESLFYLSAGRSGPEEISELNEDLRIGQHGQYALGFLELNKDKPVHPALIQSEAHAKTLKAQLAWWLSFIVGSETEARTEKITAVSVKTSFDSGGIENISPLNTGAGSSFVLKLLVMCLSASPGELLLIENPEIHLHPGAQSRLGRLLAFIAARGVQFVVETHCEHLVNRIRYEIYRKQLTAKDAVIHYKPGARDAFETLSINERGHYCDVEGQERPFPGGFFDSTLAELLEIG